ncbi:hypothetical protein [Amycolatopsis sp. NPDC057786]|uniref:hypothetical protein n=1 Tax=Amycolatopsis sp. NPDC057786 TaxID=3346250 RepID=UPI0036701F32
MFTVGGPRDGRTETIGTRPPTTGDRTAARVLGRALTTAGVRDRVATKTTSPIPPGHLRMRSDCRAPGAARLLIIVSDGKIRDTPRRNGQQLLDRSRATGRAVLWISRTSLGASRRPRRPCT